MSVLTGRVLASALNVRSEDNTDHPPVGVLQRGDEVTVLEVRGRWLRVRRRDLRGFVGARFVRLLERPNPLLVDAAHWNGAPEWSRLADDARFCGAMLKATQGTDYAFAQSWFVPHWRSLRAAGGERYGESWFRAAYHYLEFLEPGEAQADFFLDTVQSAGGFEEGDLPPVVDVERGRASSANSRASAQQVVECTRAFVRRVAERSGRPTILYGRGAMRDLRIREKMGCRYLWNPGYTGSMPSTASIGWETERVAFWQYTDGSVPQSAEPVSAPGLGACDVSRFLGGDLNALAALCREDAGAPAAPVELWSVRELQERLTELGYNPGFIDGVDGPITRRALDAFRREHDLAVDGPLDSLTQSVLAQASPRRQPGPAPDASRGALRAAREFLPHPQLHEARFRPMTSALADYFERVRGDTPVAFGELVARTAEWFLELDVQEQGGQNRGPWVDFIRGVGSGTPDAPAPWCAYFVSACLRIARWAGEFEGLDLVLSGSAARLYISAPAACKVDREHINLQDVRGAIFVRARTSDPDSRRQQILQGARTRGHTGVVVGVDGRNLVAVAGNSSGAGHARVRNSGAVAVEILGPDGSSLSRLAWERLAGVVRYAAPARDAGLV